ncbi:thioesterase family protein [Cellulomonas sp. PhB143]|uniref:acyl-CoA thioesterase n=1 Tax=Cellulomonas sp. PhB143 TaxID=2485186 RepID=UPI000F4642A3|nr:thioesterase family protein [Cellulomonas sp. PhB143]ROS78426.1 acyl-CoA thioester hydrolase [Cellulomonas sp. PhB143]
MSYRYHHPFPTRWNDNDQYGHMNNAVFYEAMDTAVNVWMGRHGLDPQGGTFAFCVTSGCTFHASASFPDELSVGVGVERLGTTSITWSLGILREDGTDQVATGTFVHVFVDAVTRRPVPVPERIRAAVRAELMEDGQR